MKGPVTADSCCFQFIAVLSLSHYVRSEATEISVVLTLIVS